jgi:uncharacterized damage-inducible protein DinB
MSSLRPLLLAATLLLGSAAGAAAQDAPPGFREEFLRQFDWSMSRFVQLAEAMPAERFSWSPGEGVMPVARVYAHVARYNYQYPACCLEAPAPDGRDGGATEEIAEKAAVVALLGASGEHVRAALAAMSDADLAETTELYGREVPRWSVLLQLLAHMNEHLGQSIAYARMNGVVPPWSR